MNNGFFEGVSLQETQLATGQHIHLPVRYLDWSAIMAHFPAPAEALRRLLPNERLKPAQLTPGTGILTLVATEYRQIAGVEPYNELGIMVPVLYEPLDLLLELSRRPLPPQNAGSLAACAFLWAHGCGGDCLLPRTVCAGSGVGSTLDVETYTLTISWVAFLLLAAGHVHILLHLALFPRLLK